MSTCPIYIENMLTVAAQFQKLTYTWLAVWACWGRQTSDRVQEKNGIQEKGIELPVACAR